MIVVVLSWACLVPHEARPPPHNEGYKVLRACLVGQLHSPLVQLWEL